MESPTKIDLIQVKAHIKQEIDRELEIGNAVDIHVEGFVVQKIIGDNQDGSVNVTYVVKPMTVEIT